MIKKILKAKTWRKRQLTNLLILSKTLFFLIILVLSVLKNRSKLLSTEN